MDVGMGVFGVRVRSRSKRKGKPRVGRKFVTRQQNRLDSFCACCRLTLGRQMSSWKTKARKTVDTCASRPSTSDGNWVRSSRRSPSGRAAKVPVEESGRGSERDNVAGRGRVGVSKLRSE